MEPQQPGPQNTLQPPEQNPYDFIINPPNPPKAKLFGLGGGSFGMTIALIVGGALLLMVILAIVATLFGSNKTSTSDFISLAQTQQEVIRVANRGTADATQQSTKNLAVSAEYAVRSQQQQVKAYLAKRSKAPNEKELVLKQNAQTDLQFKTAKSTSTFDLVFSQVMQNELDNYARMLKQFFNTAKNPEEREMLGSYYEQTQLLISQIPYAREDIDGAKAE